ncbi:MAG: hypothetical protein KC476_06285 [Cyanobacteria bacterium HKST-UBA06]|nr:hypothetical protein [Cyanobacteria bacterium HKST-UBA06]
MFVTAIRPTHLHHPLVFGALKSPQAPPAHGTTESRYIKEADLLDTIADLLVHAMRCSRQSSLRDTSSADLAQRLVDHVQAKWAGKKSATQRRLTEADVAVICKRITPVQVRYALNRMVKTGRIELEQRPAWRDPSNPETRTVLINLWLLTHKDKHDPIDPVERILLRNLPVTTRIQREIEAMIRTGRLKSGKPIPMDLAVDGMILGASQRDRILNRMASGTDAPIEVRWAKDPPKLPPPKNAAERTERAKRHKRHRQQRAQGQPPNNVKIYHVKPAKPEAKREPESDSPTGNSMLPVIDRPRFAPKTELVLLYDMLAHPDDYPQGKRVASTGLLTMRYGKQTQQVDNARQVLVDAGILATNGRTEQHHKIVITQHPPTPAQQRDIGDRAITKDLKLVHSVFETVGNSDKAQRFDDLEGFRAFITFPKAMGRPTQRTLSSEVARILGSTPLPVYYSKRDGKGIRGRFNPALNFNTLKTRLAQLTQRQIALASGGLFNLPFYSLPTLWEPQIKARPTLRLQPHGNHIDLALGLVPTTGPTGPTGPNHPNRFTPLHQLANTGGWQQHGTLEDPAMGQHNAKRYGLACLEVLKQLMPMPGWDTLARQDHIPLHPTTATTLLGITRPLQAIGFNLASRPNSQQPFKSVSNPTEAGAAMGLTVNTCG